MKLRNHFLIVALAILTAIPVAANHVAEGIEKFVAYDRRPASVQEPQYAPAQPGSKAGSAMLVAVDSKQVVKRDISTGKDIETIFDCATSREIRIPDFEGFALSPDGSRLLLWRNKKSIYRRSFTAEYYVYEIRTRLMSPLSVDHRRQRAPIFSPDGRMVAFVDPTDNNIYLRKLDYDTEVAVTRDGAPGRIINGVPDWTYEEEFATAQSMSWAPDGLMLCYIKYNEEQVPYYSMTLYGGACERSNERYTLYPGSFDYKYPVAGEPNSAVTVHSYDIETRKTLQLNIPGEVEYIPRIAFAGDRERLAVVTLNRAQNRMEILALNPRSGVSRSILVEQENAWIDPRSYEQISWGNHSFVIFSSRSGYSHLYQYSYNGQLMRTLTSGDYDVTGYLGYDPASRRHFYQSTVSGPVNRVISSVNEKGSVRNLTPERGTASGWLSPAGDLLTVCYSSSTEAPVYSLYRTAGDKLLRVIEDNATYAAGYTLAPKAEFFDFRTDEGITLNGMMVRPRDFDPARKYPVIMYQYSGPGSQEVLDRWTMGWMNYFADHGYVIVTVDGRGTGGRGRKFQDCVYKNLGQYETIDQVAAARYVAAQPWADASRIGIFGWSYGGYETLMAITTGGFNYAAAVAVAPVTDWRFYDTVYAERYMLTPAENPTGYRDSAPIRYTDRLNTPLLIIHGTADDNVHLANTIEYVSALEVNSSSWCRMLLFPNMNHSIFGCNSREVLYSAMLQHFDENLKK